MSYYRSSLWRSKLIKCSSIKSTGTRTPTSWYPRTSYTAPIWLRDGTHLGVLIQGRAVSFAWIRCLGVTFSSVGGCSGGRYLGQGGEGGASWSRVTLIVGKRIFEIVARTGSLVLNTVSTSTFLDCEASFLEFTSASESPVSLVDGWRVLQDDQAAIDTYPARVER